MSITHPLSHHMKASLAMVVPVWFPRDTPESRMHALLSGVVSDVELFVEPRNVLLYVDGCPHAEPVAWRVVEESAARLPEPFGLTVAAANQGKGGAVATAFEELLLDASIQYLCVRDCDGDHSIYDLPHLLRLARQIEEAERCDLVAVCGRRFSLHRPLGFWRGEYELITCEVTWEALKLALAREGRSPTAQYVTAYSRAPDIQSGYKLYTRRAAELAARSIRRADAQHSDLGMLGWGVELVPFVEIHLARGIFGEMQRLAWQTQPVTSFDQSSRCEEYARELIWVFKRLAIEPEPARRLLDAVLPRSLLYQDPSGRQELLRMRRLVLDALGGPLDRGISLPDFT
jgi:hypothetical protein